MFKIYELPRLFWDDHSNRYADYDGHRREARVKGGMVHVELDEIALAHLKGDARFHAGPHGFDNDCDDVGGRRFQRALRTSAQRTLRWLAMQS